ncbi:MAG: hypothetical protein U9N34_07760, partial [Candidatus Cloacimonadota bacterium]|nr:hypothetical protein [Candidatus Cloacimonadota bacterium]
STQAKAILNEVSSYVTAQKKMDANISVMSPSAANLEADGTAAVTLDSAGTNGFIQINDLRDPGTATACVTLTLTSSVADWTSDFDNFDAEKNVTISHTTNANAGCPNLQEKISVGSSVVKGRSAKF